MGRPAIGIKPGALISRLQHYFTRHGWDNSSGRCGDRGTRA